MCCRKIFFFFPLENIKDFINSRRLSVCVCIYHIVVKGRTAVKKHGTRARWNWNAVRFVTFNSMIKLGTCSAHEQRQPCNGFTPAAGSTARVERDGVEKSDVRFLRCHSRGHTRGSTGGALILSDALGSFFFSLNI